MQPRSLPKDFEYVRKRRMAKSYLNIIDKRKKEWYNRNELYYTVARYVAERYYREESPGFIGQDN